ALLHCGQRRVPHLPGQEADGVARPDGVRIAAPFRGARGSAHLVALPASIGGVPVVVHRRAGLTPCGLTPCGPTPCGKGLRCGRPRRVTSPPLNQSSAPRRMPPSGPRPTTWSTVAG